VTKILLYESKATGHHPLYLRAVIEALDNSEREFSIVLAVNPSLLPYIRKSQIIECVFTLSRIHCDKYKGTGISNIRSIKESLMANEIAEKYTCDAIFFMDLNLVQGLGALFVNRTYGGIYFGHPKYIVSVFKDVRNVFLSYTRKILKQILLNLFIVSGKTKYIGVIVPFGTDFKPKYRFNTFVGPIYDPILSSTLVGKCNKYELERKPNKTINVIIAGGISKNKLILEQAKLLRSVGYKNSWTIHLHVVGKVGRDKALLENIHAIDDRHGFFRVKATGDYIDDEEFRKVLQEASYVSVVYKNTEYASGVLGIAAAVGTPVIALRGTLVSEAVEKFNLGYVIESLCVNELERIIINNSYSDSDSIAHPESVIRRKEYLDGARMENFEKQIMAALSNLAHEI